LDKRFIDSQIKDLLSDYHKNLISSLKALELKTILKRKNPYLFRAKSLNTSEALIKSILDAYISSSEEGMFGTFLEQIAILVCEQAYGGAKSTAEGIDLEFSRDNIKYLVAIKSGPNWSNSSSLKKLRENFLKAKRILGTNSAKINVVAVNGCCYGRDNNPDKGDYLKLCGQRFWEFITGDSDFYLDIIEPLDADLEDRPDNFEEEFSKVINKFTREFSNKYCDEEGAISWSELLKFNSGM